VEVDKVEVKITDGGERAVAVAGSARVHYIVHRYIQCTGYTKVSLSLQWQCRCASEAVCPLIRGAVAWKTVD
jgi:hypothetical protein